MLEETTNGKGGEKVFVDDVFQREGYTYLLDEEEYY